MSPDTFRRFLKPRYSQLFDTVKSIKPDMLTYFHSDHIGDLGEAMTQSWIAGSSAVSTLTGGE